MGVLVYTQKLTDMKLLLVTALFLAFVALSGQSASIGHLHNEENWRCDFIKGNGKVDNKLIKSSKGKVHKKCELLFNAMVNTINESKNKKWGGKKWEPCGSKHAIVKKVPFLGDNVYKISGALHSAVGHNHQNIEAYWDENTKELNLIN